MTLLLQWLAGPVLRLVLAHFDRRVSARGESERLSADLAAQAIRAEMDARSQARAVLLAEQGSFFTAARLGRLMFVVPLGIWWSAVIADSIFAFSWTVAALPSPLDEWAGAILLSLFLVDGLQGAVRATRARRGPGKGA
jgi:hypothetical protein